MIKRSSHLALEKGFSCSNDVETVTKRASLKATANNNIVARCTCNNYLSFSFSVSVLVVATFQLKKKGKKRRVLIASWWVHTKQGRVVPLY